VSRPDDDDDVPLPLTDEPSLPATESTARLAGSKGPTPRAGLEVGSVLDRRYEIERVLGAGGAGRVFLARDGTLGERVALKVLRPERAQDGGWIRRLGREVKVARAIRHPNVCRVFDLGLADGHWFVTMEVAEGGTLRALLDRRAGTETVPWAERLRDARAVCAGLAAIHAVGITHRDITPQNVLLMRDGRLVISDFGLAIGPQESTTFHGGTPQYMAPEVLAGGRADTRADVWQLGLLLHEILFSRRAEWEHAGDRTRLKRPIPAGATEMEEQLYELCTACLTQDPAARPPDALAVAGRLAAAENAKPSGWPLRVARRARRASRRPGVQIAAVALVLAAAAVQAARVISRPRLCLGGPARIAGVWYPPQREAVRRAFLATGRAHAEEAFGQVSRLIDEHLAGWLSAYKDSCEATHVRGEQSPEVLDLRTACLNDDLEAVKAVIHVFADADAALVDSAPSAAGSLSLARCWDPRQLRAGPPPPKDPRLRARVEALRRELDHARALFGASRDGASAQAAAAVVAAGDELAWKPLVAEALAVEGEARANLHEFGRAGLLLQRAVALAEEVGADQTLARAAAILVYVDGETRSQSVDVWMAFARAALARIGGDPEIAWLLQNNRAIADEARGALEAALATGLEAVQLAERTFGANHVRVTISLASLALIYDALGRHADALATVDRCIAILRRWMGPGALELAKQTNNRGEYLLALGRPEEARRMFTESIAAFETQPNPENLLISAPYTGLGRTLLALGKPADAIAPLEHALSLRESSAASPAWIAEVKFHLARALDAASRDRPRARTLAEAARTFYATSPRFDKQRAEVTAWLARR
jgi:tetratricopeptide (TPR) repeat protein